MAFNAGPHNGVSPMRSLLVHFSANLKQSEDRSQTASVACKQQPEGAQLVGMVYLYSRIQKSLHLPVLTFDCARFQELLVGAAAPGAHDRHDYEVQVL